MNDAAQETPRTGRRFRVHGRVQGVGYRWWTRALARRLGVTGSVRNLPDGTVEVRASAPADTLARFHRELATGPAGAAVDGIDACPDPDVPDTAFAITR